MAPPVERRCDDADTTAMEFASFKWIIVLMALAGLLFFGAGAYIRWVQRRCAPVGEADDRFQKGFAALRSRADAHAERVADLARRLRTVPSLTLLADEVLESDRARTTFQLTTGADPEIEADEADLQLLIRWGLRIEALLTVAEAGASGSALLDGYDLARFRAIDKDLEQDHLALFDDLLASLNAFSPPFGTRMATKAAIEQVHSMRAQVELIQATSTAGEFDRGVKAMQDLVAITRDAQRKNQKAGAIKPGGGPSRTTPTTSA